MTSLSTPIGVGVLGSGFMGRTWSEVAAHHTPGTRLAAVAGGRRGPALAADYGVPLHGSLRDLAADPAVDLVVVTTPPAGHHDQVLTLARAGKHVLVEKPMAQSVEECAAMVRACADAGVALAVVSQHRFRAAPRAAKRLVDDGAIGQVTMVRAIGPETGFWDTSVTRDEWKLDPTQQTTYASWGAHACDLIRWYVGDEPDLAFALFHQYGPAGPPLRSAMATYRFRAGAMAQVWMSYDVPRPGLGSGLQLQLIGESGMIELDAYGAVRLGRGESWETAFTQPPFDPLDPTSAPRLAAYAAELHDLATAADDGRLPSVHGGEGLATTAMLEAAERSARTAEAVPITLPGAVAVPDRRTVV
ncbi:Gfo/Idh/MocA family oxidoreductase [Dactylosporangium fulvum]|uniref:Gfo/Idh/MocA family oxidoreductase n=1 Tax=Dactylosporangium fulvum TaxID=53359 RepID=A0ABY5VQE4_9ACTN|nr:Gfo/Idh/MocA family oxidoreductase [Dactylosporangium fulvum]UWP79997.1 Gfo/Idh/MocA family oxidoreductase [Dactylosporangium fulvum]